jgi:hypothetical protein
VTGSPDAGAGFVLLLIRRTAGIRTMLSRGLAAEGQLVTRVVAVRAADEA